MSKATIESITLQEIDGEMKYVILLTPEHSARLMKDLARRGLEKDGDSVKVFLDWVKHDTCTVQ